MTILAITADELRDIDAAVDHYVGRGWRVESRTEHQVVLAKGQRPNHLLHFFLTIFTLGLWALVWLMVSAFGGEKRKVLTFY